MPRLSLCIALLLTCACGAQVALSEPLEPIADYQHLAGPLVEQYCSDCHSGDSAEAGLELDKLQSGDRFQEDRNTWKDVVARLKAGDMPPADYDAPTDEERAKLVGWIEAKLAQLDCSVPQDPGWVTLRRLNRDQYRNTIRDLLMVDFQPAKTFPPDDLAYGFDNNADMLSLTPVLLEKYLNAARDISRQALLVPESQTENVYDVPRLHWQGGQSDRDGRRELWSNGAVEFVYEFPKPGRYWLRVRVSADQAGPDPVHMAILDKSHVVQTIEVHVNDETSEEFTVAFDVERGKRRLGVAFTNDYSEDGDRNLFIRKFELIGPYEDLIDSAPRAHKKWFAKSPTADQWRDEQAWRPIARESLEQFATVCFRRPVPEEQIDRLIELLDVRRQAGDTYERAVQVSLEAMLVSPRFLFIGNIDHEPLKPEGDQRGYPVDEYELAARLSYFLWSSMPDATLLRLAGEGRLRAELGSQVNRMLRDRRAEQFTKNFTGQWLGTRLLVDLVPDEKQFNSFDGPLRRAMAREAQMLFAEVVRRDLPITTLLDADFTYLNERLAKHYGISGVEGRHFRRVEFAKIEPFAGERGGVITMAGVLSATSNPDRTSPVKRGKWVLGELLGAPPPDPPPGITALEEVTKKSDKPLSMREQMALHREDPSCAVCHEQMDAIGLALENYDLVGRWRTEDSVGEIDASGELPSGEKINGASDLTAVLLERREGFRRCLAEKLMIYALGRGLEYYDECAVREIARRTAEEDDKMRALILAVIESAPFQQRRYESPK
ncbi:DUF1592 domain-containing protein [Aeoliella sp.]|uniref:DUF1592 domain-containing protein n=1 Tax=Aeoliella sp. TaxID=2795800 RepID=UPI003CCB7648